MSGSAYSTASPAWDGDQVLMEQRVTGSDADASWLDWGTPSTVAYAHMGGIDAPVAAFKDRDSTCSAGVPACLSTIDRFVWDGDQLLAEHRINAPYTTHGDDLERESD